MQNLAPSILPQGIRWKKHFFFIFAIWRITYTHKDIMLLTDNDISVKIQISILP